jgi:uncharacterized oxidoreductase
MRMTGKAVLITGGASGIGLALARTLVARGNDVVICGRRRERIDAALASLPGLRGLACDVARDEDIARLLEFTQAACGRLDVLINNAGVQNQSDIAMGTPSMGAIDEEVRINLGAPMKLALAALPLLLRQPAALIVNMCSLLAIMPKPNALGYCASKAGLYGFSKALRLPLEGTPVKVAVVFPPVVATPMTEGRGHNKMPADDFAAEMLRQLESGRTEVRVGQAATILALHRFSPALAGWWTRRISRGPTRPVEVPATQVGP